VLISLVIIAASCVTGQEKVSPCPRIFNYDLNNQDTSDTWSGVLTLDTQIKLYGVHVDLVFDRAIISLSVSCLFVMVLQTNKEKRQTENGTETV
jgi:Serine protease gd N-terminus